MAQLFIYFFLQYFSKTFIYILSFRIFIYLFICAHFSLNTNNIFFIVLLRFIKSENEYLVSDLNFKTLQCSFLISEIKSLRYEKK